MKNIKLLLLALFLVTATPFQAQISVHFQFGAPPVWAPPERQEAQYYYLPDIDSYYDVPSARFIYLRNGIWIHSKALPYKYRNYNLRTGNIQYLTNYRGKSPYKFHAQHLQQYHPQQPNHNPRPENHNPQQPNHNPQQPNHNPRPENHNPQQPNHNPRPETHNPQSDPRNHNKPDNRNRPETHNQPENSRPNNREH